MGNNSENDPAGLQRVEETVQLLIDRLDYYNRWRRGEEVPQPDPRELGQTLQLTIHALQLLKKFIKIDRLEEKAKLEAKKWIK